MQICDRTLPSGKTFSIFQLHAPPTFDFLGAVRYASKEAENPPLSLEDDLGPDPPPAPPPDSHIRSRDDFDDFDDESDLTELEDEDSISPPPDPLCAVPPSMNNGKRQSKRNSKRAARKKRAKQEGNESNVPRIRRPEPSERNKAKVYGQAERIQTSLAAEEFAAAKGAHTGKRGTMIDQGALRSIYSFHSLRKQGLRRIHWDGVTPTVVIDRSGRIITVLCGRPEGPTYLDACARVLLAFRAATLHAEVLGAVSCQRRGPFIAVNVGLNMGMGSRQPVLLNPKRFAPVVEPLLNNPDMKRIAGYQEECLHLWAPRLYDEYVKVMEACAEHNVRFKGPFNGCFSSAAFNFGGNVWTYKHRDFFNWPFGWCLVTSFGRFDHLKGGQIILWELGLVVDFPHGSTVAIPSAAITHSNRPVSPGEERYSFTQYSSGPIFRWVYNGKRTEGQFKEEDEAAYEEMVAGKENAYIERVKLYSTVDEIFKT